MKMPHPKDRAAYALITVLLSQLAVGCAARPGFTGAGGRPPRRVAGHSFVVVTVDGQRLPITAGVVGRPGCAPATVGRIVLAFGADRYFRLRVWRLGQERGRGSTFETSFRQAADGRIALSDAASSGTGQVRGDTLTLDVQRSLFCDPHTFTAVAHAAP